MKLKLFVIVCFLLPGVLHAQLKVNSSKFNRKSGATFTASGNLLRFKWPVEDQRSAEVVLNMDPNEPLFKSLSIVTKGAAKVISTDLDPAFLKYR